MKCVVNRAREVLNSCGHGSHLGKYLRQHRRLMAQVSLACPCQQATSHIQPPPTPPTPSPLIVCPSLFNAVELRVSTSALWCPRAVVDMLSPIMSHTRQTLPHLSRVCVCEFLIKNVKHFACQRTSARTIAHTLKTGAQLKLIQIKFQIKKKNLSFWA